MKKFAMLAFLAAVFLMSSFFPGQASAELDPKAGAIGFVAAIRGVDPASESYQAQVDAANQFLDIESMSRKALGAHWEKASNEERSTFLSLMSQLIEKVAYPRSRRFMGDYEITYPEVEPEGQGFNVVSLIKQQEQGLDISVVYHVYDLNGQWKVDDVLLDDVSITEDLQYQFVKIIAQSQFSGLLDAMRKRLAEAESSTTAPAA